MIARPNTTRLTIRRLRDSATFASYHERGTETSLWCCSPAPCPLSCRIALRARTLTPVIAIAARRVSNARLRPFDRTADATA